ncbi:acyltransferase [Thiomicrorhabdus immobilis]|uniref:L-ornithine N(alpha)-acyltransferase n=1 Tax=Thiomicrorhabdus immobilis TaxID=2791037 RepID=A0ABM7MFK1_9GAMM|nr:lysophospholipid acyltransferase family protein [Thiomicrorhabdus immobilis]BCN94272.1 acyltransferase [Thiomicrorhabdus immobilis]
MLNIEAVIAEKFPELPNKKTGKLAINLIKSLAHEKEINAFIETHQHLKGFAFLDEVLNYFNFSYTVNSQALARIPAKGKVIMVANHPIGSLDGLALLKMVRTIRPDVRIVASDLLNNIEPLKSLFLGVDNLTGKTAHKTQFKQILDALNNEEAVIMFPAGEVSRIRPNGVRDGKWKAGFLKLAQKAKAPIQPIYVDARNSSLFYALSTLYKPLGTMMLVKEMFNKKHQQIQFFIGKQIPWKNLAEIEMPGKQLANQFRKYLYKLDKEAKNLKKGKAPIFKTEETIAPPVDRQALKKALKKSQLLGQTQDGKKIYLYDFEADSPVMHEIGRLRELTFRTVEEGTGTAMDLDAYDNQYRHLVLWDEEDLEIVGAYRLGECANLVKDKSIKNLYTSTLFNLKPEIESYLPNAIELGRSFVQPKYWGKRSLDYLWYGIGAYVAQHPEIKYLFGPVSLSDAYPQNSKELIVGFYQQQFGSNKDLAEGIRPVELSKNNQQIAQEIFSGDYKESYKKLNALLDLDGVKVPTLFKQYTEVADDKGCRFIDFSIDPEFNDCIDALILVELDKLKPKKRERYLNPIKA